MMWLYSMQQAQLWPGLMWSAHWSVKSHLYTDLAIVGKSAGFHMNSSSMATILVSYRMHESTAVVLKWSEWRTSHLPKSQLNHSFLSKAFSSPQRLLILSQVAKELRYMANMIVTICYCPHLLTHTQHLSWRWLEKGNNQNLCWFFKP